MHIQTHIELLSNSEHTNSGFHIIVGESGRLLFGSSGTISYSTCSWNLFGNINRPPKRCCKKTITANTRPPQTMTISQEGTISYSTFPCNCLGNINRPPKRCCRKMTTANTKPPQTMTASQEGDV
ncbi:hypothetical protein M8C21_024988 [Ambrosia artemisiifolia]|uniref:Uncharacterized protein n=1 Tax=Ambrosia artemisiifolia TaxID=4212 RepID=A0AAD5C0Q4_AMBAR|nr:hypothetical protein M8C21_024988 [Ambrosia artemisiifolia]